MTKKIHIFKNCKKRTKNRAITGLYNYCTETKLDGAPKIDFSVPSMFYLDRPSKGMASASFPIFGDGIELFSTDTLYSGGKTQPFKISVTGIQKLELIVEDGGDGTSRNHADWCDLKLFPPQ